MSSQTLRTVKRQGIIGAMTDGPRVEAIDRALILLTALAEAGPDGAPLTELSGVTGVNKSTAYRALSTMRAHGFVAQSEVTGDYRLGTAAMTLGERFLTPQSLVQSLHPALVALSREADELVHLGVLVGDEVLYLDKVEPERTIRVFSEIGRRTSAAASSMGRALLAARGVPDDQLAVYLHHCGVTVEELSTELTAARTRGFATDIGVNEAGVACLGTALMRGTDAVAAVSITMPAERLTAQRQGELAALISTLLPPLLPPELTLWRP